MRVSIAMATYNGGRYVSEQLTSFADQTHPPDELVVCDDGSSDDTVEHLEVFVDRAPFEVRIERNPVTLKTTKNFEKALSLCTGDVIFFADQDDIWLPQKIATHVAVLGEDPQAGAVLSNGQVVDRDRQPMGCSLWESLWFDEAEQARVREGAAVEVFLKHVVAAGTTLAFRREFSDLILPFPDLRHCHDSWTAFLIAAVSEFRIHESELIQYRVHDSNQFGIHRLGLREQLAEARKQISIGAFEYAVEFFSQARDRLLERAGDRCSTDTLARIEAKIAHCERRDAMSGRLLERLPVILGETMSRRYWRYSYGAKSLAQDLFLR